MIVGYDEKRTSREADRLFWGSVPRASDLRVYRWAEEHFRAVGSPISEDWKAEHTPWLIPLLDWLDVRTVHSITFIGPAQGAAKSTFGEIAICYCIATRSGGDIQYNWQNDLISKARYKKRVRRILQKCEPVMRLWPDRNHEVGGLVAFPHLNFTMQGVEGTGRLESDTVWVQVNEECHEWDSDRLGLADNRLRKVRFPKQLNLSTGGVVKDALHRKHLLGTQQEWQQECTECHRFYTPEVPVEDGKLGGLKYDSEKAKLAGGGYDYDVIAATAYSECPHCGARLYDDVVERRRLAVGGRLSEPKNESPDLRHRSVRLTGPACPDRPFVDIIKRKHEALRALAYGDRDPYREYLQREEAGFWDPDFRGPGAQTIDVTPGVRWKEEQKQEDGAVLLHKLLTADFQAGRNGDTPHFPCVARAYYRLPDNTIRATLLFEGRKNLKEDVDQLAKDLGVDSRFVLVDSGYKAKQVYQWCLQFGWNAIKGEDRDFYLHDVYDEDGKVIGRVRRIYSPLETQDPFVGDHGGREGRAEIPFIRYSKQGILDRYEQIRNAPGWEFQVPEDVSETYRKHHEPWSYGERHNPRDGTSYWAWAKWPLKAPDDLFMCEAYQAMFADILELCSPLSEQYDRIEIDRSPANEEERLIPDDHDMVPSGEMLSLMGKMRSNYPYDNA